MQEEKVYFGHIYLQMYLHKKSLSNSIMQQKQQRHNSYNKIQSPTIVNIHYRIYLHVRKHNIFKIYVKLKVGEIV